MEADHTLSWLVELLEHRIAQMGPRDRTLTVKFGKAGARKLLTNLEHDLRELEYQRLLQFTHPEE